MGQQQQQQQQQTSNNNNNIVVVTAGAAAPSGPSIIQTEERYWFVSRGVFASFVLTLSSQRPHLVDRMIDSAICRANAYTKQICLFTGFVCIRLCPVG